MAFHPYPQLIKGIFNFHLFGPPRGITRASPWPWIDHRVSGLSLRTKRPFQTRFRYGYTCYGLTLHAKITRWLIMQKVRGNTCVRHIVLPLLVGLRFQNLFHSPARGSFHLSLTVLCAIGHQVILSLGAWSPRIPSGLHVSGGTRDTSRAFESFVYRAVTFYGRTFQNVLLDSRVSH